MGFVRSNRRILSKGPLQAVTPVPAAPRPHRQPFDTSHLDGRGQFDHAQLRLDEGQQPACRGGTQTF